MSIAKGLRNVLRAASGVTDLAGTYLTQASIFAEDSAPADFSIGEHGPFILIGPAIATVRQDTTTSLGSQTQFRARIYGASDVVEALAEAASNALHQSAPSVTGLAIHGVIADDPVSAPTDSPSVKGRSISIRLFTERA